MHTSCESSSFLRHPYRVYEYSAKRGGPGTEKISLLLQRCTSPSKLRPRIRCFAETHLPSLLHTDKVDLVVGTHRENRKRRRIECLFCVLEIIDDVRERLQIIDVVLTSHPLEDQVR